ncbi:MULTISPECIES: Eco57I restriction-modification methylase domain-containing protein [unclassified Microcoleus]|uniref:Eco57I restriction-modification methylase domain-containing protein n=1 Tax=unclassified Microcoleus TaxID=2642155 RepID=UPI002FD64CA3
MPINRKNASNYLKQLDFQSLFIEELGWDSASNQEIYLTIDGQDYPLEQISQKRGMVVYGCKSIPDYAVRTKIDKEALKYSREHFIVYYDGNEQVWQWVRREQGKPILRREQRVYANQSGEALLQKLDAFAFSFEEEENLNLVDVTSRAKKVFDVDKVTKKFYELFKKQHEQFLKVIQGFQSNFDQEWYASLMLNRLMFIYFMQKKGFLDGNINYLQDRLALCQQEHGNDQFYSFYRYFLLRLFHDGLGKQARTPELEKLLGKIPYLNGGLFEEHPLEQANSDIQIPDTAFKAIFNFFDQYHWHLDDRPLRSEKEINPDVLGYIFEKYINQKQMGAYYTKEDITEYISKNCIIPFLFDATKKECAIAFESNGALWRLLKENPDRYIYQAVRKGVDIALPTDINAGISDVSKRTNWNKPASADLALPTETWREHVARRTRCLDLRQKLSNGEVTNINDLITYNLDIRQFAQDAIANCEGADFLLAFYRAIERVSILDPTCGSGAFLFAALNILEPLYDGCLERIQSFLGDCDGSNDLKAAQRYQEFRQILDNAGKHNNRRYFILKSITINNLYGVDIMEEATEICKLRLFLKLVSQVNADAKKPNYGIEPLPDIDFNIRAGNTLVGFATQEEVEIAITGNQQKKLDLFNDMDRIDQKAKAVDITFREFQALQSSDNTDGKVLSAKKIELRSSLAKLNDELNRYLADEYQKGQSKKPEVFQKWKESHQPFHWFVEFYGIVSQGGFDVIIGNPPYVEYSKVKKEYTIKGYQTESCGNLYANSIERSLDINSSSGYFGMIIPLSAFCTQRMIEIWNIMLQSCGDHWISHYGFRPSKLFDGVNLRLAIALSSKSKDSNQLKCYTSKFNKWNTEAREYLLESLSYASANTKILAYQTIPKMSDVLENSILDKICIQPKSLAYLAGAKTGFIVYYKNTGVNYWITATDFPPKAFRDNELSQSSRQTEFYNSSQVAKDFTLCLLNSNLFFYFYTVRSNCRDLNPSDIKCFPIPEKIENNKQFTNLAHRLMKSLDYNSKYITREQKQTGSIRLQSFYPSSSKPIIDEIDRVLAQHYGFTDEELDFIINYDIKYRMGKDDGEEE